MNIVETILNSQGGQAAQNLSRQFGLNPQQVQSAVQTLVPQLVTGLKDNISKNGVQGLIGALQSGKHMDYLQNAASLLGGGGQSDGEKIVQKILGDQGMVSSVIAQVSAKTGIDASKLQAMLPAIAAMVMGALGKAQMAASSVAGGAAGAVAGAQAGASAGAAMQSPLGQMAGGLLGKLSGAAQGAAGAGQGAASGLLSLLDANKDGNIADDVMNLANKFLKR